jgi:phospholipase D1/2
VKGHGSLIAAIETLNGGSRRLEPLDFEPPTWIRQLDPDVSILDPERPIEFDGLREQFLPDQEVVEPARSGLIRLGSFVLVLALLAAAWRYSPLADWIAVDHLMGLATPLRESALGPAIALLGFVAAANLMVPVTALIVASALVFGWAVGFAVALTGSIASAAIGYAIGARLWRDTVRRLAGRRLDRLSRWLGRRGLLSVMAVRVVPVAPFAIANIVAGASHIRLRDFVIGTALGMAPGTLLLTLFAEGAVAAVRDPRPANVALLMGIGLALVATAYGMRRLLNREE